MSEPIFAAVEDELGTIAHAGERVLHGITSHFHRHPYHDSNDPTGAPAMSLATTLESDFTEGLDYVEGWVGRVKSSAPDVLAKVQKYAGSPVVAALEEAGAVIDAPAEQVIAGWIRDLVNLKLGTVAAAPAAPAPAVADPAPAA